jgi:hypothetical protein
MRDLFFNSQFDERFAQELLTLLKKAWEDKALFDTEENIDSVALKYQIDGIPLYPGYSSIIIHLARQINWQFSEDLIWGKYISPLFVYRLIEEAEGFLLMLKIGG